MRSLFRKKERQKHGLFLVEGVKPISELLRSSFNVSFIAGTEERIHELGREADDERTEFVPCDRATIESCSALEHPEGLLAVVEMPDPGFDARKIPEKRPLLCIEGLQDPGNLGTLFRIADHFALGGLLLSPDSVDPFNPKVVRSSMGAIFEQPVYKEELPKAIETLRGEGRKVVATEPEAFSIYSHPLEQEVGLLFGSESHGLSEKIKGMADESRSLPALGRVGSLNVAVSAGIFCSELLRGEL